MTLSYILFGPDGSTIMAHSALPMAPVGLETTVMRTHRDAVSSEIARWASMALIVGLIITWSSLILGIGWPIKVIVTVVSWSNSVRYSLLGNGRRERDITLSGNR